MKNSLQKYFIGIDEGITFGLLPVMINAKGGDAPKVKQLKMISRKKIPIDKQVEKKTRRSSKNAQVKLTSTVSGFETDKFDWEKFLNLSEARKKNKVKSYFKGFYELDKNNFETEFEIVIEVNKSKRTLVIQENIEMSLSVNVTASLKKDKDGRYTTESLESEANKRIEELDFLHL